MRKLNFTLILTSLLIIFSFIGCQKKEKVRVGISIGPYHERWTKDSMYLANEFKNRDIKYTILMAKGNEEVQKDQVRKLVKSGIDVLVIAPINSISSANCVQMAKEKGIKTVAYDRIIRNCDLDFYISFDNEQVGELQAEYITRIKPEGQYAVLSGSPNDYNSVLLKLGQMNVLQPLMMKGDIKVVLESPVANWNPDNAFKIMDKYLTNYPGQLDAVIASSDAIADGVVQALKKHDMAGKVPVSGQDAQTSACRRIMAGTQTMTVYKVLRSLAYSTANIAESLAKDKEIQNTMVTVNNGKKMVPAVLLQTMQAVNKENIPMTVVADGFVELSSITASK